MERSEIKDKVESGIMLQKNPKIQKSKNLII
jgi:hypothetical protein